MLYRVVWAAHQGCKWFANYLTQEFAGPLSREYRQRVVGSLEFLDVLVECKTIGLDL